MPVPPQCQSIADSIDNLESQLVDIGELTGAAKAAAAAKNARLHLQISAQKRALDHCILAFGPGYETEVQVIDVVGSTTVPYTGQIWSLGTGLMAGVAVPLESAVVQQGLVKFVHTGDPEPGNLIGFMLLEPSAAGPLFRSGPMPSLPAGAPANPAGLVEVLVPQPAVILAATLPSLLPSPGSLVGLPAGVTITALTAMLGSDTITLTVSGTYLLGLPFGNSVIVPITYALPFGLAPSHSMVNLSEIVTVVSTSAGSLTTAMTGFAQALFNLAAGTLEPQMRPIVINVVQKALNASILAEALKVLHANALPPGMVLSARRVLITPSGVALGVAAGAFGGIKLP